MKKLILILILLLSGCSLQPKFGAGEITAQDMALKYDASKIKAKYQLNEVSLIKTDIKNPELDKYENEPKDEVKVTIGDNTAVEKGLFGGGAEFKPDIELKRWDEVSFKLKTDKLLSDKKNKTMSLEGEKIKFKTDKMDFEMYAPDDENYKYVWYLNEKPKSNIVEFEIESQGLDFFYQPALDEEMRNETCWTATCTPTDCCDSHRPENVVGSYAVYHSTKGGMNDKYGKDYKTGQAFMIYRPHIIDAKGNEIWGKLHIENGIYSVEIPQEFLDKAIYPLKSNDTFGYTTLGGSAASSLSRINGIGGALCTPSSDGSITKVTFGGKRYSSGSSGYIDCAIYLDDGTQPYSWLATADANKLINTDTLQWFDLSLSYDVTASTAYWLMVWGQSASVPKIAYNSTSGVRKYYNNTSSPPTFDTWPSTLANELLSSTIIYSIYATYTAGGGTPAPEATSTKSVILNGNTILNGNVIFK